MPLETIVCCTEITDPRWRFFEKDAADFGVSLTIVRAAPRNTIEKTLQFLNFARIRGGLEATLRAKRTRAKALVAFGPPLAAWCALFARLIGLRIPILAHSFNFAQLPSAPKRAIFQAALSAVDRFVVFSATERELYASQFRIPVEAFDFIHWGIAPPRVETPETPFEKGAYVCAIGGNARDYRTLIEAARQTPDIPFVLVVRPDNLRGLPVPKNVKVHVNLSFGKTMNILAHARFMVLPLEHSRIPCGHVTLVAAMFLGKTFVITDSTGIQDYVQNGENALTVRAGSPESVVAAARRLWADPELCRHMGAKGRSFAETYCTEKRVAAHFRKWLESLGLSCAAATGPTKD
jgi:glycosyltransferase involved in cell wall biosynthesis